MRLFRLVAAIFTAVVALAQPLAPPQARAEAWRKLLTPAELATLLAGPDAPRLLDIRQPDGPAGYAAGRIPGAVSAPYAAWRGPKENPGALIDEAALTDLLRRSGVALDRPVVVAHQGADDTDFGAAARVYWTLRSAGVAEVAILNGGVKAWAEAGLPLTREPVAVAPTDVVVRFSDAWLATRDEVAAATEGRSDAVLVDARPEDFFRGLKKHDAALEPGTLFGAISLVHATWFAPKSPVVSLSDAALARARALAAEAQGAEIVSFCNTGHWAATNWFVLSELAGVPNVKLYPESTVGWSRAGLPLAPGG